MGSVYSGPNEESIVCSLVLAGWEAVHKVSRAAILPYCWAGQGKLKAAQYTGRKEIMYSSKWNLLIHIYSLGTNPKETIMNVNKEQQKGSPKCL